jgi:hypothetical protein
MYILYVGKEKCQRDERDGLKKKKRVIIPSGRLMRIPIAIILDFISHRSVKTIFFQRFILFCLKKVFKSNLF